MDLGGRGTPKGPEMSYLMEIEGVNQNPINFLKRPDPKRRLGTYRPSDLLPSFQKEREQSVRK